MTENKVITILKRSFFTPILALKKRYIPLLMIYFAYGAQAITAVALSFWEKESLTLSAEDLVALAVWIGLPFTIKMIFGQLVDVVPIFGSRRRAWVFLGAILMSAGYLMLYGMAVESPYVTWIGGEFNMYLAAQLVMVLGFVIQDVTADTMTTEVVDRDQPEEVVKTELAMVQVLGRLALLIGSAITYKVGGDLAAHYKPNYETIFLIALLVPLVSIVGAIFVRLDTQVDVDENLSLPIFGGGVVFAIFTVLMAFSDVPLSQEITFCVSFILICWMLSTMLKGVDSAVVKSIIMTFAALFIFRATPNVGPGYRWWTIDELGFDQEFIGLLGTVGDVAALVVLWFAADFIAKRSIRAVLILLIILGAILSLPDVGLYYGIHDFLGVNPRTIALLDIAAGSPLVHLSMIPMLAMIAFYAPVGKRATWFAVSASLMNLASAGGNLLTKYLLKWFLIDREIKDKDGLVTTAADYSQLGSLLWIVILVSLIIPLIVVLACLKEPNQSK